ASSYDDIKIIRNQMEASDWAKPSTNKNVDKKVYVDVGTSDCSAGWWKVFSDYFTIPANSTLHTQFINHTSGTNNWNNWNLVLATNADRGGTGYSEYFVLRSDKYGWGNSDFSLSNLSGDYGSDDAAWTTYRKDMEGATVDMTIARSGGIVKVTAVSTAKSGTVYTEAYTQKCGDGTQAIRAFFACDGSYLQIDPSETFVGTSYKSGSNLVGAANCSAAWWTAFSDYYKMSDGDKPLMINFINNNSGSGSNWNNWLLACTTDDARGGTSYAEHFILRSDAFGWGTSYKDGTMTNSFDFKTYVSDMHGANCWLNLSYSSGTVTMAAKQKKSDGTYLPDYSFVCPGITGDIRFFLTAELASLDILKIGYFPYYDKIFETK
ncbi:MAG TPA: glucanase, partial [Xylanibacter oryzae]|nr:glucanase [Xylanibacter oryzae]